MESFLLYFSFFFAFLIIAVAVYFIYCWHKDQQLHEAGDEHNDQDAFDADLTETSSDEKRSTRFQ